MVHHFNNLMKSCTFRKEEGKWQKMDKSYVLYKQDTTNSPLNSGFWSRPVLGRLRLWVFFIRSRLWLLARQNSHCSLRTAYPKQPRDILPWLLSPSLFMMARYHTLWIELAFSLTSCHWLLRQFYNFLMIAIGYVKASKYLFCLIVLLKSERGLQNLLSMSA